MMYSASSSAPDPLAHRLDELNAAEPAALSLLVQWTPRHREFFGNLFDLLLMRRVPKVAITARPARFWGDVFVPEPFPKRGVMDSLLVHVFVVVAVYGFTVTYVRPPVQLRD
ncbi:MAG TPA: hypothetical protein VEG32_01700, partial [Clostridia bacterium]|nr:hypothetical protein [Clostridia bacterium]